MKVDHTYDTFKDIHRAGDRAILRDLSNRACNEPRTVIVALFRGVCADD